MRIHKNKLNEKYNNKTSGGGEHDKCLLGLVGPQLFFILYNYILFKDMPGVTICLLK